MRQTLTRCALALAVLVLATTCDDPPPPPSAFINFEYCVGGQAGVCGGDDCCANENNGLISEGARVTCSIFEGPSDGTFRATFNARTADNTLGLRATDIIIPDSPANPSPVRGCEELEIRIEGNRYPTSECTNLEPRPEYPPGGGCEIQAHIDNAGELRGQFRCQEIQLPSQTRYVSTLNNGTVGWGTFQIANCSDRR